MSQIHPNYDCPHCDEPALVDTSTNFKREWSCNFCHATLDADEIDQLTR